MITLSLDTASY